MDGWAGLSLAPEVMPSPIRHSLSQAEDVNIVNGVHELGHKWCAYPRQPCTHYDGFRPVSLCTYPLNLATSGPRRNQHLGTCLPACHRRYQIAQRLPGRTDHAIRNRYHRLQAMMHDQHLQAQQNQNQTRAQLPEVHSGAVGL